MLLILSLMPDSRARRLMSLRVDDVVAVPVVSVWRGQACAEGRSARAAVVGTVNRRTSCREVILGGLLMPPGGSPFKQGIVVGLQGIRNSPESEGRVA
jgi:hypothetical protein